MNATAFKQRVDGAEPINIWPLPDMSVLSAGRREPPAMPPEMFGPAWPLLMDMAQGAGAPVDYVAVSFLVVAAPLIGGKRKVRPYVDADWSEPCSGRKLLAITATTATVEDGEGRAYYNRREEVGAALLWEIGR